VKQLCRVGPPQRRWHQAPAAAGCYRTALIGCGLHPQVGETYDWRLSISNMERRDGYFTRLKLRIEMLHGIKREKVRFLAVAPDLRYGLKP